MKLTLIEKRKETKDIVTFIFEPEIPMEWIAGQYLIYSLPHKNQDIRGKMRFFTISSPPFEKNPAITTRISKNKRSSFKNALDNLKIGSIIDAKGLDGDFVVDNSNKKQAFLAGGVGITPFASIIKQLNYEKMPINVNLFYTSKNDFAFKEAFDKIQKKHKEFKIYYLNERINKDILKQKLNNFKDFIFYVSGPDPMVEQIEKLLLQLGVKRENIKADYFSGYKDN